MNQKDRRVRVVERVVVAIDVCSSSDILEDLQKTGNIKYWLDLLLHARRFLAAGARRLGMVLYKFSGDGWILLFDTGVDPVALFVFLKEFSDIFHRRIRRLEEDYLESPPSILGLTFGMDKGTLIRFRMADRIEYVGRAINVSCRLQSAIKDKDKRPQYKVLMTKHLHTFFKQHIADYPTEEVSRKLHNISGGRTFKCVKISI